MCGNAMTPAEAAAYGPMCEDCWVGDGTRVGEPDSLDQVRALLSPGEWEVECRVAAGHTYAEVARDRDLTADALKVRAGRWRARVRRALALC
jgi:hypothetical protein